MIKGFAAGLLTILISFSLLNDVSCSTVEWKLKIEKNTGANIKALRVGEPKKWKPCSGPSVWLFLLGEYRTFHWTKKAHLKMIKESAPDGCWYVVIASGTNIGDSKWQGFDTELTPVSERPPDYVSKLLYSDVDNVFEGRMAYTTLELVNIPGRPNIKLHAPWKIALKTYTYAAWALSHIAIEELGFRHDASSVVVRSRPDLIFTTSFDFTEFRRQLTLPPWYHHMQVGQQIDADLNMFSSYGMWDQDVGRPMETSTSGDLHMFSSGAMWSRSGYMAAHMPECVCLSSLDVLDASKMASCPKEDVACQPYVFQGWENHEICRFSSQSKCDVMSQWGKKVDVTRDVKNIYASKGCERFALKSRAVIQDDLTEVVDLSYAPGKFHRRSAEGKPLEWFRQKILRTGSDVVDFQNGPSKAMEIYSRPNMEEAVTHSCSFCKGYHASQFTWCVGDVTGYV